jgi:hypothetical protein|tara:strand:- start:5803 stop:5967 length:165 start_codon:yes stop_codon:yes gene_type:complete
MADAMRAMLDQLMGTERDVPLDQRTGRSRHYSVRATPRDRCPALFLKISQAFSD